MEAEPLYQSKEWRSDVYREAIAALHISAATYKVQFVITYGTTAGKYDLGAKGSIWRIKVMGKLFTDLDFIKVIGLAVEFVVNAHEHQPKKDGSKNRDT